MAIKPPFCLGQESSGVASRENYWASPKDGYETMEMASGVS